MERTRPAHCGWAALQGPGSGLPVPSSLCLVRRKSGGIGSGEQVPRSLERWKAAQAAHGEPKPQQLRTKFILNHTPRSSQLIAELETIRELPNYCQLEHANQAPAPTPRPALTTKCQTSLEADMLPPSLPSSFQTQQRGSKRPGQAGHCTEGLLALGFGPPGWDWTWTGWERNTGSWARAGPPCTPRRELGPR